MPDEKLRNFFFSPSVIRMIISGMMRWAGFTARIGVMRNAFIISVGKPEGKGQLGRPRHR
jgi:hypothetical protein